MAHLVSHQILPFETSAHGLWRQSPKDAEKLKEAKERVYLKGFYEGVMKARFCVFVLFFGDWRHEGAYSVFVCFVFWDWRHEGAFLCVFFFGGGLSLGLDCLVVAVSITCCGRFNFAFLLACLLGWSINTVDRIRRPRA